MWCRRAAGRTRAQGGRAEEGEPVGLCGAGELGDCGPSSAAWRVKSVEMGPGGRA